MNDWFLNRYTRQVVQYVLLAVLLLYLLSGFGITEYRFIEFISFGVFSKPVAFIIHTNLLIPLLILLMVHILQGYFSRRSRKVKT